MNSLEDEVYREAVKKDLNFSSWAGTTKSPEGGLCVYLFLPFKELIGLTLEEKEELPMSSNEKRPIRYIYTRMDAPAEDRLVITTLECGSVLEAHEALVDVVMTYMAPTLPTCASLGIEIGDICFGSHGQQQLSMIFARYNVLVEIRSVGTHGLSVSEFAESIDSLIYSDPVVPEGREGLQPVISKFSLSSETTGINGEIVLGVEASDPNTREIMIRIMGTGGTISRKGEEYIYHAEKKGKQNIRLSVINEDGLVSKAVRVVTVE